VAEHGRDLLGDHYHQPIRVDSYSRHANAYVTKPLDLDDFTEAVDRIHDFHGGLAARPRMAG
jgi:hypothetical protein